MDNWGRSEYERLWGARDNYQKWKRIIGALSGHREALVVYKSSRRAGVWGKITESTKQILLSIFSPITGNPNAL